MYLSLVVGFWVGLCLGMHYFVSFLVLLSSWRGRESRGCFAYIVFLISCPWLFLTVSWIGVQCVIVVIVVFSDLLLSRLKCKTGESSIVALVGYTWRVILTS